MTETGIAFVIWVLLGVAFVVLGIPVLKGENSAGVVISILGTAFLTIITMAVYVTDIKDKDATAVLLIRCKMQI